MKYTLTVEFDSDDDLEDAQAIDFARITGLIAPQIVDNVDAVLCRVSPSGLTDILWEA